MKRNIGPLIYLGQLVFLLPPIIYWYDQRGGNLDNLDALAVFPLLGLLALTMMWYHLMIAWVKRLWPDAYEYQKYYRLTGNVVLALIILHPGLLFFDFAGKELSVYDYVSEDNRKFVVFGTLALLIFLVYEVVDRLRESTFVKRNHEYIVAMNRIGFILIYVHGLQLGQHLQSGWLRGLWLFYGVTSLAYFIFAYYQEITAKKAAK